MDDIRPRIRTFLGQYIREEVDDGEDIFASGYVNSLFVMQLVLFVENELGCPIADEDLELENFNSIDAIAQMVGRKTSVSQAS
ncbi:MAG TPA: phosphopantetheine-binding protein [Micromonosporaceae bacterium]|nr:phosphopantetheine-binding protein [Micromonosporaceae bacterium]